MKFFKLCKWVALALAVVPAMAIAAVQGGPLDLDGDFEGGSDQAGIPAKWQAYGETVPSSQANYCYSAVKPDGDGNHALFIKDNNEQNETGITISVPAGEKLNYTLELDAKAASLEKGSGAFMQIRFLPSQQFSYREIVPGDGRYRANELSAIAPDGTVAIEIYLYTHRLTKPDLVIDNVRLAGETVGSTAGYRTFVRELCLDTDLVKDGKPAITVVTPASGEFDAQAAAIVKAVKDKTGVELPVRDDHAGFAENTSNLTENLLLLGNRNNNLCISSLYNRHFVILDLAYPGEGGSVVRSLHNPFGDGHNVIFAGGSDAAGTAQAVERLATVIRSQPDAGSQLKVGRLADIVLGKNLKLPERAEKAILVEASPLYGSYGYFGWNILSKNMALYYLTGDEKYAREFLRLAFPDAAASKYIDDVDKEFIELKNDPLAGPYHYNGSMMILYWDLIEESPVFSDADREKIVAAFFRQLGHWEKGPYHIFSYAEPAEKIGDRHALWEALCTYALCRYLNCHYPTPQTGKALKCVRNFFAPLESKDAFFDDNGSLFWFNTSIAPLYYYTLLSGTRSPAVMATLKRLAAGQTTLVNGFDNDWATGFASNEHMMKMAYLLDDRAFVDVARKTGFRPDRLMLGQSFLPEKPYSGDSLAEQVGSWNFCIRPPEKNEPVDSSTKKHFFFCNYRSEAGPGGDFLLLDGSHEPGRNIYHCLALLGLRLGGVPLLAGYHNQVSIFNDGMYDLRFPKFTELEKAVTLGDTAWFQGVIPDYNGYRLKRTIWLERGRFAIFADTVTAVKPGKNAALEIGWEFADGLQSRLKPGDEVELFRDELATRRVEWRLTAEEMVPLLNGPAGGNVYMRMKEAVLIRTRKPGESCRLEFTVDRDHPGELILHLLGADDRGEVRIDLDGKTVVDAFAHCSAGSSEQAVSLGRDGLKAGKHTLELTVLDSSKRQPQRCFMAIRKLAVYDHAEKDAGLPVHRLSAAGKMPVELRKYSGDSSYQTTGNCAAMKLDRAFKPGEAVTVFTVLAPAVAEAGPITAPFGSGLAARLPETAIVGQAGGTISLLRNDGFSALDWQGSDGLGKSSRPVDLVWHFAAGELLINCPKEAEIELAAATSGEVKIDPPVKLEASPAGIRFKLVPGTYRLTGIRPADAVLARFKAELAEAEKALAAPPAAKAGAASQAKPAPALPELWKVKCADDPVAHISSFPAPDGSAAAAAGRQLCLISPDGRKEGIAMSAPIGALHWWNTPKLLLVGSIDDKVVAFDATRRRQWEFTSEMAPEVEKTSKFYWYKSPDFHPGVWGISAGPFLDGKEQAFIGGACTLEIVDRDGKLQKRLPEFWGPLNRFELIPMPDGSTTLAAIRAYSDGPVVGVLNNRSADKPGVDFHRLPEDCDAVYGFTVMNNTSIICTDLDGDGKPEVVVTRNGAWNRVMVYDLKGNPLCQANLGPGEKPVAAYPSSPLGTIRNINDLIVADLAPQSRQIVVALARKTLLGLDARCQCLWSRELESEPLLLAAGAGQLFAACRDGRILQLDAAGRTVRESRIAGIPTALKIVGDKLLAGSDRGEVAAFKLAGSGSGQ